MKPYTAACQTFVAGQGQISDHHEAEFSVSDGNLSSVYPHSTSIPVTNQCMSINLLPETNDLHVESPAVARLQSMGSYPHIRQSDECHSADRYGVGDLLFTQTITFGCPFPILHVHL